ncbi:MAG: choice-of-anchor A family protein, partial [Lachnospiraceae bacterium]|nr:choice-of-anchor A family protein [Lachnospiraceae bacterium]
MVSVLLTIVLVLGLFQGNCADAASADDRYTSYNASSILKRYSVFVQRDYNANNHIIGAIAVGGTYKNSNFFGDVMTFPSYINNWASGGLGNGAVNSGVLNYLRSYGQSFGRVVYYGTKSVGVSGENIIQNPGYINMDSAFSSLRSQSQVLKERGTALSGNTLNLNGVETDVYVTISSDKLNSLNIQVPSYTWFRSHTLVISVTGSSIDYNGWSIKINGRDIGNNFRSSFPGATTDYNVQLNCTGMNLFWNFPDATRVNAQGFAGHMIAPKADVTINSGNFEGGIIARSFTSNSEAHFYPCSRSLPRNNNDLSPTPTPTNSPAPTATNSPAPTATNSPAPTATNSPAPTNSPTPTTAVKKSNTPTPTVKVNSPTPTKAVKKSNTPTPTTAVKKSNTPTPTPTTVVQKTNTPTPTTVVKKTNTPTPTTVLQKTNTPTPTTEVQRTNTPTPTTQAPTPTQAEEGPTPTTKVTTPTPTPYRR